ncbi:GNAT family N-acetyltransferase [Aeoliella mucimassa]|uniref:N-acetyltransferase domain-containing protein n=1 Tax=Aeoliella mucimassa TaxID=2527972 RepID=A0A518ARK3_9BACT|nr:GNAT family N-acetyltransferase [Aeoliella mucimassa]QDU57336.1 hypothetical protein Pan181_35510 [Aeoliella mucimassa]
MDSQSPAQPRWSVRGLLILTTLVALLSTGAIFWFTNRNPYEQWVEQAKQQEPSLTVIMVTMLAAVLLPMTVVALLLRRLSREAAFYTALPMVLACIFTLFFIASVLLQDTSGEQDYSPDLTLYGLVCWSVVLTLISILLGAAGILTAIQNPMMILETARLQLELESLEQARERLANMPEEFREMISADWLQRFEEASEGDFWVLGFTVRLTDSQQEIGQCGFKGPPDQEGVVEIAYTIDDEQQGKGYATEIAMRLTEFAFREPDVHLVCAHTLPEQNASTRVLTKCGFTKVGESIDPEDGLVWRWEIQSGDPPDPTI